MDDQRVWKELLARPDISLVVLCGPFVGRIDLVVAARDAGKAVIVAEPPFLSLHEIDLLATREDPDHVATASLMPLRMLLEDTPGFSNSAWTKGACGVLTLSRFTPTRRGAPSAPGTGGLSSMILALAPYVDLVCHLFGHPVGVQLAASGDRTAAGLVKFASGALLSLAVTLDAPSERDRLEIMDVPQSIVLDGRRLQVNSSDGVRLLELPSMHDLRLSAYRDIAAQLTTGGSSLRHGADGGRGLALFLDMVERDGMTGARP
ncbi:hypothetical protein ACIRUY_01390 [Streptomyces erythrochromogenes]|uniref:hypothetical protein n=1 Tax=Streptomyces erythrochromogenes TaxID=285574 RepID=UPI0037F1A23A